MDKKGNKLGYLPVVRKKRLAKKLDAGGPIKTILLQVNTITRLAQLHIEVFKRGT